MQISQENKDMIKHALISILVGAIVAFLNAIIQGLLNFMQDGTFNSAVPLASMLYYMKGRKIA
jgi:hypothetical protein